MARQSTARTVAQKLRRTWFKLVSEVGERVGYAYDWTKARLPGAGQMPSSRRAEHVPAQSQPQATSPSIAGSSSDAAPAHLPDGVLIYAVGDVHGRADLLISLFARIEEDAAKSEATPHLVMLGDYIDRGFQSKQVIDFLMSDRLSRFETYFIKGNHEAALMNFLESAERGPEWANYGGRETLVSYGVRPPRSMTMNDEWVEAHRQFTEKFPEDHLHFMRALELSVRLGDYGFVHAGTRPGRSFEEQQEQDLLWIREEFLNAPGRDDVVVVHGHTPADDAYNDHRRINVDTGAYFSGRLTAVRLEQDQISFLKTR
ncbi:metallophosphoesterase family protein [Henriciella sp.]|uniref:metallophosphoesterase family protein n=1 Tax=Henriciella sp. TaxID=1968823 RepID=UPI00263035B5|nr:metallophosphoesterase family protein [Henriciella sp.]